MGMSFATGVAAKENDFLWLEAIGDAFTECLRMRIADLLNYGWGEHISILCSEWAVFTCNPLCD